MYLFGEYAEILSKFYVIFVNFTKNDYLFTIEGYPKERQLELKNRVVVFDEICAQMSKRANLSINYSTIKETIVDKKQYSSNNIDSDAIKIGKDKLKQKIGKKDTIIYKKVLKNLMIIQKTKY